MMILHHYPMSPFSEKMRLMYGYCDLEWQSVMTPESPPRPLVDPLAGGYRRIPVAQLGADVFCDSRIISAEVAQMTGKAELDPGGLDESDQARAAQFEGEIFWAAVTSIPARRILGKLFRNLSFGQAMRFLVDRVGIARHAHTKPVPPKLAGPMFEAHLQKLEQLLVGGRRYLGGDAPGYLDFAAYHTLWFKRVVGEQPMPDNLPTTTDWYERLTALGHGQVHEGSANDALAAARDNAPRPIPAGLADGAGVGTRVMVQPDDYALDGTSGTLVGADSERWIVVLDDGGLGEVHAHFPRQGFRLS